MYSIGECDDRPFCRDRSFFMTRNTGSSPHYMDVTNYDFYPDLKNGFTFELKFKLTFNSELPDKLFLAGVWGPFEDFHDSWVLYINKSREICFEISNDDTELGDADNTVVKYNLADSLVNRWYHATCVFDPSSQSISLYLDSELKDTRQNPDYPIDALNQPDNIKYGIQIGTTNALYNEGTDYLSFLGEMDEIKIWNKVLTQEEIICSNRENFIGVEDGLSVYYRCNSEPNDFEICDATGNGRAGQMRSNAQCRWPAGPRWQEPEPYYFTEIPDLEEVTLEDGSRILVDTIKCTDQKTYSWTFIDTSNCANTNFFPGGARLMDDKWVFNRNANGLSFTQRASIINGVERSANLTVNADFVGTERYRFYLIKDSDQRLDLLDDNIPNVNRYQVCSRMMWDNRDIYITRITDANYTADSIDFGVVISDCVEQQEVDIEFFVKNNTIETGINDILSINKFEFTRVDYEVIEPQVPVNIPPGESIKVVVRFNNNNTPGFYNAMMRIFTSDRCEDFRAIPIFTEVRDIITINAGGEEITEIDFGPHCIGPVVATQPFFWENLLDENITIERVIYPEFFEGPAPNNQILEPETASRQNYFGFLPQQEGTYSDTIWIEINAQGCKVRKPILVSGRTIKPEYAFSPSDTLDFGDVFIGQNATAQIEVENTSQSNLAYRNHMLQGDYFEITSQVVSGITSGTKKDIDITFTPTENKEYVDLVRIEDNLCFDPYRVYVKGRGVINAFNFEPAVVRIDNITACRDSTVTLEIKNTYDQQLQLTDFRLDNPGSKFFIVSPQNLITSSVTLDVDQSLFVTLRYDPSDLARDRSDIAYLEYRALNQDWKVKITGTSIVPRVYMTDELNYGSIEVTTSKQEKVLVENITGADIKIDGFTLKDNTNFQIVKPLAPFDTILKPRESMEVIVEFAPDQPIQFRDSLFVLIDEPCTIPEEFAVATELVGFGEIIPMEINQLELSFGQVSPCDCITKVLPLRNRSRNNEISIDSVYLTLSQPSSTVNFYKYFDWSVGNEKQLPRTIQNSFTDSLYITYCPRAVFSLDSLLHSAKIHVEASGPGWVTKDDVFITGRQMLLYETTPEYNEFPPTRVDTFSVTRNSLMTIPSRTFNEAQAPIKIDSISFSPDENVFYYSSSFSDQFPLTYSSLDSFWVDIDFKPRAPRDYRARMLIHMSEPCKLIDSTVEVFGSGFAPAFGLDFVFKDTLNQQISSSFSVANCDTLKFPIYTSRDIPGDIVNIKQTIKFDTTKFQFEGIESKYLDTNCLGYMPYYEFEKDSNNQIELRMFNLCGVDVNKAIYISKFIPINGFKTGSSTFEVTDISFDTEEVILFDIVATTAFTNAQILQADFRVLDNIDFGGVNILDCRTDSISIQNTGELNILVSDLLENIDDVEVIDIIPPYGSVLAPGDMAKILFEFCPKSKTPFDSTAIASVLFPCELQDSTIIKGFGTTPPYEVSADITTNFIKTDTIGGSLKEIISIPIYFEKDMSVTYNETEYWMTNLSFGVDFEYNPRALKYLEFSSNYQNEVKDQLGKIEMNFENIDSLRAGKIGEIKFEITLSDSLFSEINMLPKNFDSDIMFYDLFPILRKSVVNSIGACNLSYLNFRDNITNLSMAAPNPVTSRSVINFSTLEDAKIEFNVYDINGNLVKKYFDDNIVYNSGEYNVEIIAKDYDPGVYYYTLRSGNFFKTQKMLIAK
jgi:hypothetical protein